MGLELHLPERSIIRQNEVKEPQGGCIPGGNERKPLISSLLATLGQRDRHCILRAEFHMLVTNILSTSTGSHSG